METRRSPQAILSLIGSRCNPKEGIGTANSQSIELGDYTDSSLAFSVSS